MSKDIRLDVAELERAIANLLVQYPELESDEKLRADMMEGEGLHDIIATLLDREREAKTMQAAIALRQEDLAARKKRYHNREEAMRELIQKLMEKANVRNVTLPEGTMSIAHRKGKAIITDESKLPDDCVTRSPNKTAINKRCRAGDIPDGVIMGNGYDSLTITVK